MTLPFFDDDAAIVRRVHAAADQVSSELLARRNNHGEHCGAWTGRLSSSSLATATAVSALSIFLTRRKKNKRVLASNVVPVDHPDITGQDIARIKALIAAGIDWIKNQQNDDGGWGDTPQSLSNVSTTLLVKSALLLASQTHISQIASEDQVTLYGPLHDSIVAGWSMALLSKADAYLKRAGGVDAVLKRYGDDRTFAVPILANAAMAGLIDWQQVPSLPFELAIFPQSLFRFLHLPVVSYAIPALVAIGQVQFFHEPRSFSLFPPFLRRAVMGRTLKVVEAMQPASGGFLEAIPLTAFVVMSLSEMGLVDHPIIARSIRFLLNTARDGGSWGIDINLATWVTTLAMGAFDSPEVLGDTKILSSILTSQHKTRHPFTGAEPGGWGWTPTDGAVPDADDTSGAVLTLARMRQHISPQQHQHDAIDAAAEAGLRWLFRLQQRDGGIPTFCRGWGRLDFDRSSVDITAHALRAFAAWSQHAATNLTVNLTARWESQARRAVQFLVRQQQRDGSWIPLWFGNEHRRHEDNPFYGTAKVLAGLAAVSPLFGEMRGFAETVRRSVQWITKSRNESGGWGRHHDGRSSVEETAVVVEALATVARHAAAKKLPHDLIGELREPLCEGVVWLLEAVERHRLDDPSPIGLYFAKLWYSEELYPRTFVGNALRAVKEIS